MSKVRGIPGNARVFCFHQLRRVWGAFGVTRNIAQIDMEIT